MAIFVGQLFFNQNDPPAGWSETYYPDGEDLATAAGVMQDIATARLAMVPPSVSLVYARVSDTIIRGDSFLLPRTYPDLGTYTGSTIYKESLAVMCREEAGTLYRTTRWIRGIPAENVTDNGLFSPVTAYNDAFTAYHDLLILKTSLRVKSKTDPARPIIWAHVTALTITHFRPRKIGRPFGLPAGRQLIA